MIAGIPGLGLNWLFYLTLGICMLFSELRSVIRRYFQQENKERFNKKVLVLFLVTIGTLSSTILAGMLFYICATEFNLRITGIILPLFQFLPFLAFTVILTTYSGFRMMRIRKNHQLQEHINILETTH